MNIKLQLVDMSISPAEVKDEIDMQMPYVRPVTMSEYITLINNFALLLRRNNIQDAVKPHEIVFKEE